MADFSHFSILQAMDHPSIWKGWFRDKRTWEPWRAFHFRNIYLTGLKRCIRVF
jgi:hypothetical protein